MTSSSRTDRRGFLAWAGSMAGALIARPHAAGATAAADRSRVRSMLLGSLIGDALGGPIEFADADKVRSIMPAARQWPADKVVNSEVRKSLADSLAMHSYHDLRPHAAAYGPWHAKAKRGTITDDSRHKIVLMRALREMLADNRGQLTEQDLARQYVSFRPHPDRPPSAELAALVEEGLREYRYASRWILGERDLSQALPPPRLWAGVSNCSGQMTLIPLAAVFPGQPKRAYQATFGIDFIDAHQARDIASAINAGLAAALDPRLDDAGEQQRWQALVRALRTTDPYRLEKVPFAQRPLERWLALADSMVDRCEGRPARLYELLEQEGQPVYYWDAHFTLLVPLAMLKFCHFDPLSAMHLTLDFGHDTDSYAQLLGAMAGAVHGMDIFPESMSAAVEARLMADYGESVDHWVETLMSAANRWPEAPTP